MKPITLATLGALGLVLVLAGGSPAGDKGGQKVSPALNFKMAGIDGKEIDLSKYQGKVVLIVNVASQCGYTPQYKTLQALYKKHADDGLVVLGVPSNEFGKQEPGTDAQIVEFCSQTYGVTFPMTSKTKVNGKDACDLYKFLTAKETNAKFAGKIGWNFEKFLIGRNGEVIARFPSKVDPESAPFQKAIQDALAKKE